MVYHPYETNNHAKFNDLLPTLISQAPTKSLVIIGHDINCNVGTCVDQQSDLRRTIGPFGLNNKNKKGSDLINTLLQMELKVANSFSTKKITLRTGTSMETHTICSMSSVSPPPSSNGYGTVGSSLME